MAKNRYLKLSDAKIVSYQTNPIGVNEVSIYMENSGAINQVILSGAHTAKLKIGLAGTYPVGNQTYPFAYNAGDRVFVSFTYDDLMEASANIKLKCLDN
jgi:hypothetical protein